MAQVKCKNGHYYNNEIYPQCPYCDDVPPLNQDSTPSVSPYLKTTIAKILAALTVIIALGSFVYANSKEQLLNETQQELKQKSKTLKDDKVNFDSAKRTLNLINSVYGYGSKDFYADTPVLVLNVGGTSKDITVKCNYKHESFIKLDGFTKSTFNSGLSKDIKAEWVGDKIRVTPGSTKGFNIIHVFSEDNTDSFDILVLVK